ncbi:MAG TPA: type II toxin-antitoxin system HicB family antitoxin [Ruminiclostridium sp.]
MIVKQKKKGNETMRRVYPVIVEPVENFGYAVSVHDLDIHTQGKDLAEAIDMARDAIGMWACYELDEGRTIPDASDLKNIKAETGETLALVDIDIDAYRRAHDNRTVRKNVTLPSWLNEVAEREDINFSQVLQEALKERLHVQSRYINE